MARANQPLCLTSFLSLLLFLVSFTFAKSDEALTLYNTEDFTVPEFSIKGIDKANDGFIFLGLTQGGDLDWAGNKGTAKSSHGPLIIKNGGDVVWHGQVFPDPYNVRRQMLHGKPVITYWQGKTLGFGHGYGHVMILDEQYNPKYNVCVTPDQLNIVTPAPKIFPGNLEKPCLFDRHESYISEQGTLVANIFNVTQTDLSRYGGSKDGWVFDALFVEVDIPTNKVLFTWSALEHVGISTSNYLNRTGNNPLYLNGAVAGKDQANPWDFFHMNSVQKVPGGYLANSRMTWSMYHVNGTTGAIEWTLEGSHGGDFEFEDPIFFAWQHMPRVTKFGGDEFEISLFNNDNIPVFPTVNQSTGLLLSVNKNTKKVKQMRRLAAGTPIMSVAEGGYQDLANGHSFVGYGSGPFVREYGPDNEIIYELKLGIDTSQKHFSHTYRAYKFDWHGQPSYPPKGAVCKQGGNTKLFMSWNGATTHRGWNCYAGQSKDNLKKVSSAKHTKFEDECHDLSGHPKYVMVEATADGKSLGNSSIISVPAQKDLPTCVKQDTKPNAGDILRPVTALTLGFAILAYFLVYMT